ncbi:MAG TPA: BatA domain-containing protein [Planctomycetota bacterium]|nr:BatA domain-containing protein [Planctomycetota bacterium]
MFTALHPLLLWGATAVAVPVLIHLLLRQRPRPRPWAAMRWLLAAAQAAQRRYKLTNLLLLLLRCLVILLIVLAIARPALPGLGGGDRLVLIIDRSASMGARGDDPGPLAAAKAELARAELSYRSVVVLGIADDVQQFGAGSPADLRAALGRLDVTELPGGLDRAAEGDLAGQLTTFTGNAADVVLVSDFQQDDGSGVYALLKPHARSLTRLYVGDQAANAVVEGIATQGDLRPNQPGELLLRVAGPAKGVAIAADDGAFLPLAGAQVTGGLLRVATPPLAAGDHRLRIRLDDSGLTYDNLLELPVTVRAAVTALGIGEHTDYLTASLLADNAAFALKRIPAPQLATELLPPHGLVAMRERVADGKRLADWVTGGGVLWATLELLADDQALRALVKDIRVGEGQRAGGPYHTGEQDLDEVLAIGRRETVPNVQLPENAHVLMKAGDAPLVVQISAGAGTMIVELTNLQPTGDESLRARGTLPLWVSRTARRATAALSLPTFWQAGQPAPADAILRRGASSVTVKAGAPLLLAPGAWTRADNTAVVVLPSRHEGQLQQDAPRGAAKTFAEALPERPGSDWGLPLAIAALMVAIGEGLMAAWAGRTYG